MISTVGVRLSFTMIPHRRLDPYSRYALTLTQAFDISQACHRRPGHRTRYGFHCVPSHGMCYENTGDLNNRWEGTADAKLNSGMWQSDTWSGSNFTRLSQSPWFEKALQASVAVHNSTRRPLRCIDGLTGVITRPATQIPWNSGVGMTIPDVPN